ENVDEYAHIYSKSESDEFDKSFDYLSNGKDEVIELMKRKIEFKKSTDEVDDQEGPTKAEKDTPNDVEKYADIDDKGLALTLLVKEHEKYMEALWRKLKGNKMEIIDPFAIVKKSKERSTKDKVEIQIGDALVGCGNYHVCRVPIKYPDGDVVCYTKLFDLLKRYPFPKSTEFNADHYAILVAHLAPFWKFLEPFLCLDGMSCYYTLDEDTYASFLHDDEMNMDLFAFIQVTNPTKVKVGERERAEGEAKLVDSIVRHVVPLLSVAPAHVDSELEASTDRLFDEGGNADQRDFAAGDGQETETELVTGVRIVVDENVAAENLKRLRKKRKVVTDASGSSYPPKKLRGDNETSSGDAIGDSSHHSSKNASGAEDDSVIRSAIVPPVMTEAVITTHVVNASSVSVLESGTKIPSLVHAFMFHDFDSIEIVKADTTGPSYFAKQDLSIGSRELNSETMHQIHEMDYHHLFTEFNVGTAGQACLNAEVKMRTEYCLSERKRSQKDSLVDQVHALETTCFGLRDQVAKLDTDILEMALHLEEKFYPHLLTTIFGRRWLLTHGLMLKLLGSQDYLLALGAVISHAIEKGMHDGLSTSIDHRKAGRSLADIVAYNPAAKVDYNSALQRLGEVEFPLLAELKSHKDASTVDVMNLLRLENVVAQRSALIDIWVPLVDSLSAKSLIGEASTSGSVPTTVVTMTALSNTFAAVSFVPPITIEDYEIVGTYGLEDAQGNGKGNVASFPTV
nr:dynein regulator LIS1 [Tanacetum cinerariifolium]